MVSTYYTDSLTHLLCVLYEVLRRWGKYEAAPAAQKGEEPLERK